MALPIKFSSTQEAINRDIVGSYQYGVLYGIMFALALLESMIIQADRALYKAKQGGKNRVKISS